MTATKRPDTLAHQRGARRCAQAPIDRSAYDIGGAEAVFTVLHSLHRPVRLMRVPEGTHKLTRSGTPFRRVENLRIVVDRFGDFLVDGKRGLPPLPKV